MDCWLTYVWTAEGWLYVAAVIDLVSRRVVGWSMSATMTAQLMRHRFEPDGEGRDGELLLDA